MLFQIGDFKISMHYLWEEVCVVVATVLPIDLEVNQWV